jgi:hypothetical protein
MGNRQQPISEVDVRLAESDELAFPKASVESRREERPPAIGEVGEHRGDLFGAEKFRHGLRDLSLLHVCDRIRSAKSVGLPGDGERATHVAAQMVQGLRRADVDLALEKQLDLSGRDLDQVQAPELRTDQMLPDGADGSVVASGLGEVRLDPPVEEIVDGPAAIFRGRLLDPEADTLLSAL